MTKMIANTFRSALCAVVLVAGAAVGTTASANAGGNLLHSGADINDRASLQRGAKYYMSYCAGCHSLKYMRYARIGEDLGLTEKQVMDNLVLVPGAKIGDTVVAGMSEQFAKESKAFGGKAPPDLSLINRVRGSDWVYTYLKSFYLDESRPVGWNNNLFPNASMPNPLWELQGLQHAVYGPMKDGERPVNDLVVPNAGSLKPAEFDQVVRDITAFLAYTGEPAALKRQSLGVWVLLFLAIFTLLAWLLKNEYWRDVH